MHSTPLKAPVQAPPQGIATPILPTSILPPSLDVTPVTTTATRPKIYDHSDLSSSSSFSGFSESLINRARPILSSPYSPQTASPYSGIPGVITNEELANLPRYHCSSGAPTSHSSTSLSRIPRPTTPTKYKPSLVSRVLPQKSFNRRSPSKPVTPTPVIQDYHAYLRSLPPSQHVFAGATPPRLRLRLSLQSLYRARVNNVYVLNLVVLHCFSLNPGTNHFSSFPLF